MTDHSLMRGPGWVRCCICGELHTEPFDGLAVDAEGAKWDMCVGCSDGDAEPRSQ